MSVSQSTKASAARARPGLGSRNILCGGLDGSLDWVGGGREEEDGGEGVFLHSGGDEKREKGTYMRIVRITALRLRMMARKSWVNANQRSCCLVALPTVLMDSAVVLP